MAAHSDPAAHLPLHPRDHALLVLLAEEPLHGYALLDRLPASSGIRVGPATLYRTLDRMVDDGLLEPATGPSDQGAGPPRTPYLLTRLGREVLRAETDRLAGMVARARAAGSGGAAR